jgi:pimeloyl-ACP methyl ester carboxylesterase
MTTTHLPVADGTLALEIHGAEGSGPLVVLAHGMGDDRRSWDAVIPELVAAGHRVAAVDLRGCGESSAAWPSYGQGDIAGDLIALVRHLGGPAVLVGHSIAGGAATIAAAREPGLVSALVEVAPFTRKQSVGVRDLGVASYRRGAIRLLGAVMLGSRRSWRRYLEGATPGRRPAGWDARLARIDAMLREPGRMTALKRMGVSGTAESDPALARVGVPVLVVQGSADPDWTDPEAEARAIVAALPAGLGRVQMVPDAGHYPHVQEPAAVAAGIVAFAGRVRA